MDDYESSTEHSPIAHLIPLLFNPATSPTDRVIAEHAVANEVLEIIDRYRPVPLPERPESAYGTDTRALSKRVKAGEPLTKTETLIVQELAQWKHGMSLEELQAEKDPVPLPKRLGFMGCINKSIGNLVVLFGAARTFQDLGRQLELARVRKFIRDHYGFQGVVPDKFQSDDVASRVVRDIYRLQLRGREAAE